MLSPEALAERRKGIGASDAKKICDGLWYDLFMEKTGRVEPEDLSQVFPVQLGIATESLNLRFYEYATGNRVTCRGEVCLYEPYPIIRCTLDGFDATEQAVVEAKHVNGFSKIDEVRERYAPQVQHQCLAKGVRKGILSVIVGTNAPVREVIEFDEFWVNEYVEKCRAFWSHVERDIAPDLGAPAMAVSIAAPAKMRTVDMSKSNTWVSNAKDWLENKDAAGKFADAADELKKLVEADVELATGAGVQIKRTGRGLSITKLKEKKNG